MAMKTRRWAFVAFLLPLGGLVMLVLSQDGPHEASSGVPSIEIGAIDDEPGAAPSPAPGDSSEPGSRLWVLELESAAGTGAGGANQPPGAESAPHGAPSSVSERLPWGSGRIVFSVQDGSGRLLPGVSVTLWALDDPRSAGFAVTGGDGEAHFIGLAPGSYAYRAQLGDRPEIASAEVPLETGEWKELVVRLVGGNLRIGGRVLNQDGEPVAGIEISAARQRLASAVSEAAPGDGSGRRTESRADGTFEFSGLSEGEYEIETTATDRYFSVKAQLRAGGAPVDIVLVEGLRVRGRVRDSAGEPLEGVWVGLQSQRNVHTYTEESGSYLLQLGSYPGDGTLRFYLQGYEEELLALRPPDPETHRVPDLDATLRALEDAATVSGLVRTERGHPVAGAVLSLSSQAGERYQAASGADGSFSVSVKIGAGYYLHVVPPAPFLDYTERDIRVTEDGVSLEIIVDALGTGRLTGRMIDAEQEPIPNFRIWLASAGATRSSLPITSDAKGYFELAEAPAGDLSFDTRSSPRLIVSGVLLLAEGEADVRLVLDSGDHGLEGRVLDDRGDPVGGAEVSLSWSHDRGRTHSTSKRGTRTNGKGVFRFTQLGPGEHLLEVRASGYAPEAVRREVGRYAREVEVRLDSPR